MNAILESKSANLTIITLLVVLVIFGQVPGHSKLSAVLQNSGHAPVFFTLTSALLTLMRSRRHPYLTAFATAICIGVLIEIVQGFVGGDASILDVCSDGVGALASLALWAWLDRTLGKTSACLVIAVCAAYWAAPLIWSFCAYANRFANFPIIAKFSTPLDLYFLKNNFVESQIEVVPPPWSNGIADTGLLITLTREPWPGIELEEPVSDWSGYKWLNVEMTNPTAETLSLMLRINDVYHNYKFDDRFNRQLLASGSKRVTFRILLADIEHAPRGRLMDMRQIKSLIIFGDPTLAGKSFFVNRLWLE